MLTITCNTRGVKEESTLVNGDGGGIAGFEDFDADLAVLFDAGMVNLGNKSHGRGSEGIVRGELQVQGK